MEKATAAISVNHPGGFDRLGRWETRWSRASERPVRSGEVLGLHVLQELPEALHFLLVLVPLGDVDRRLGEHLVVGEDRDARADGQRDGVART